MKKIFAIDPGTTESAYVIYDFVNGKLISFGKHSNSEIFKHLEENRDCTLAIEMPKSFGNFVGDSILETCVWVGRFVQYWGNDFNLVTRKKVVAVLCGTATGGDKNVRNAVLNEFGGKALAVGRAKAPGPLYGVKADVWQALGLAIAYGKIKDIEMSYLIS